MSTNTIDNLIIFGAGFGAGASFYGWYDNPVEKVPPLGKALFSELMKFAPKSWGEIPKRFTHVFEQDFEESMYQVSQSELPITNLQRDLALFF